MHEHHTESHHDMVAGESSAKEYTKLALILLAIAFTAWSLHSGGWSDYLRLFMGVFFLVFASFKLIGFTMFAMMFAGYDIIAKKFRPYAYAYPFIELLLAFLYLVDMVPVLRDLLTLIVMSVGTIGVAQEIKKRSGIHCACLGNIIKLPLSTVSLVEDVGMGLMALVMLLS
jgi:hypothetical protein